MKCCYFEENSSWFRLKYMHILPAFYSCHAEAKVKTKEKIISRNWPEKIWYAMEKSKNSCSVEKWEPPIIVLTHVSSQIIMIITFHFVVKF